MSDKIKLGDYLIVQRQKYMKLQKFNNLNTTVNLGKDQIELKLAENHPYHTTFHLVPKLERGKRQFTLDALSTPSEIRNLKELLIKESGSDNRNITDDRQSQALTTEEILKLREECESSSEVIGKLVENSKSFATKTEYSQEKYLKRKEKKYFEYITIRRPSIRVLCDIYWRLDPEKVLGVRFDTLSQIVSYSGVCSVGNYLLYESGTNGLLPAAMLNSIGKETGAKLVHLHPGNVAQKQALMAMDFPTEQLARCVSVNIYSVIRHYYQEKESTNGGEAIVEEVKEVIKTQEEQEMVEKDEISNGETKKRKLEDGTENGKNAEDGEPNAKLVKLEKEKQTWELENETAAGLMREKFDSLVIVAKEHPYSILKALLPFVKPSRPVVIFSTSREILAECYVDMKTEAAVTYLRLTSNWTRQLQVLPNRTHPDVTMSGSSGYVLTGYTIG
ncbi:tRNA (adenine(58)-N(1))-methyltransferase non-catalytic subunit TRM6 [Anopheles ziemanni]|uniref:tRNA (adenine(58)-N(1))-methyltransferase non-catalytic subunit TRM6 n=1 Tax=Anopheles coustani TaxID=139045 RepID=UPI00265AED5F|nr:tRNA (adenine(58)-N(1))-methyltransferase non-catalytic subunit TRM6 [Anopheles coustani]XP_058168127.1 tRNA (adenine(58)-N(1))-methyltransferase non-catalytic subunit TRM6 [Anopheles ziemanni]